MQFEGMRAWHMAVWGLHMLAPRDTLGECAESVRARLADGCTGCNPNLPELLQSVLLGDTLPHPRESHRIGSVSPELVTSWGAVFW